MFIPCFAESRRELASQPSQMSLKFEALGRLGGFVFSLTDHSRGHFHSSHAHDLASITLVLEGIYNESTSLSHADHGPGTFVYKPPGERHSNHFRRGGAKCLLIEFEPSRFASLRDTIQWLDRPRHFCDPKLTGSGRHLKRELSGSDPSLGLAVEARTLDLLLDASRRFERSASVRSPGWIHRVEDYLRASFAQPLVLDDVAREAGVHVAHLARVFRSRHGCTISDFIRRLRVEYAAERLVSSSDPLVKVAMDCGFADQSHFGRVFRAEMHVTPLQYRRASQSR